jgi:phosphopentomutase
MSGRVLLIIMDGCGIGAMPDSALYGDEDPKSATLQHVAEAVDGLNAPTLTSLGLGRIASIQGAPPVSRPKGAFGKLSELSMGKDSVTGHWEMMGIVSETPFPTYPKGFPPDLMVEFETAIGLRTLGNYPASGTDIIKKLGEEHCRTGFPIVYTSADSVFQIAAHESIVPVSELYKMCETARKLLSPPHNVQRVIARPFVGAHPAGFKRTENRKDYPLAPVEPNVLTVLNDSGVKCDAIGVIGEFFPTGYFRNFQRTRSNQAHMDAILTAVKSSDFQFLFANCEDFDMLYGHRNDPIGFSKAITEFDRALADVLAVIHDDDLLIISADHGNDPLTLSTDHSRELVPLLICGKSVRRGEDLGVRSTFADIGASVCAALNVKWNGPGTSFI